MLIIHDHVDDDDVVNVPKALSQFIIKRLCSLKSTCNNERVENKNLAVLREMKLYT